MAGRVDLRWPERWAGTVAGCSRGRGVDGGQRGEQTQGARGGFRRWNMGGWRAERTGRFFFGGPKNPKIPGGEPARILVKNDNRFAFAMATGAWFCGFEQIGRRLRELGSSVVSLLLLHRSSPPSPSPRSPLPCLRPIHGLPFVGLRFVIPVPSLCAADSCPGHPLLVSIQGPCRSRANAGRISVRLAARKRGVLVVTWSIRIVVREILNGPQQPWVAESGGFEALGGRSPARVLLLRGPASQPPSSPPPCSAPSFCFLLRCVFQIDSCCQPTAAGWCRRPCSLRGRLAARAKQRGCMPEP